MQFPRSVDAARGVGISKMDLAEALATEIPLARRGPKRGPTVEDNLRAAAAEIEAETGEVYGWRTLADYREVALWVSRGATGNFQWANASWTAHVEARGKGETFEAFAAAPDTKRRVRTRNGGATGDVPAAARAVNENPDEAKKFVQGLSPAGLAAVEEAAAFRSFDDAGIPNSGTHRTTPSPLPEWRRHLDRCLLDLTSVLEYALAEHRDGNHAEADRVRSEASDRIAQTFAELAFPSEEGVPHE